jgi:hypothetical protein
MVVPGPVDVQMARLASAVARPENRCVARAAGHHIDITVIREDRHRWSPCVQLELRPADADTVVEGLVGPHPNVWTLFAFANITAALVAALGLMLGLTQWSLDQSPWGLWAVLGGAILAGGMYVASQIGQRCAAAQTRQLVSLIECTLGATIT